MADRRQRLFGRLKPYERANETWLQRARQQAHYRGRLRGDPNGPEHFYWTERFGPA